MGTDHGGPDPLQTRMARGPRLAVLALTSLLGAGCAGARGGLEVAPDGVPRAAPLVFHGNCLAGWTLSIPLRVREVGGADVVVSGIELRVEDAATGTPLGASTLDAAALREAGGRLPRVAGEESIELVVDVRVDVAIRAGVVVSGEIRGADARGVVRGTFRLTAPPIVFDDVPSGGGACAPPAAATGNSGAGPAASR